MRQLSFRPEMIVTPTGKKARGSYHVQCSICMIARDYLDLSYAQYFVDQHSCYVK